MPGAESFQSSTESLLTLGFAAQLDAWGIGTWEAEADYTAVSVRPIYLGPDEPANAPDERIILTVRSPRPVTGSPRTVDVPIGINWRGPADGDQHGAIDFLGVLHRRLDHLGPRTFGSVPVNGLRRQDAGPIGRDSRRRAGATATYLFRCRPALVNI
jgi:hypothetical protein